MFALCFEERILSSLSAVLKAGRGSSRCQAWPIRMQGEPASHWPPFWGISAPCSWPRSRRATAQIGGTDPPVDILYIARFLLGEGVFASRCHGKLVCDFLGHVLIWTLFCLFFKAL